MRDEPLRCDDGGAVPLSPASQNGEGAFDLIVVGSGIAGLVAALTAAPRARVAVVTKGLAGDGVTTWAQGGVAAALGDDDSAQQHFDDTVAAGRGLCDERAVRVLVEDAPARVRELGEWGVSFDRAPDGGLALGREAAHSCNRIVHAAGDATGRQIEQALLARLRTTTATLVEHAHLLRLLTDRDGRCAGVELAISGGGTLILSAGAIVLATGGGGQLWRTTTNPAVATGDGVAVAYEAGAEVASMEFCQFHPTALALPGAPHFLLSEAIRGEGAEVIDADGQRFLFDTDELGELAGRDVVARAIWERMSRDGTDSVLLDCRPLGEKLVDRFPTVYRTCLEHGVDLRRQPVPIAPAAHYMIGGIRTDLDGATTIPGLFACGEVASSGVHGANRLASNSLIEGAVFGSRAARRALHDVAERPLQVPLRPDAPVPVGPSRGETAVTRSRLRNAMWAGCGLVRDAPGLEATRTLVEEVVETTPSTSLEHLRLRQSAITARLVCSAALLREETRGAHVRADHPTTRDNWHGILVMHNQRGYRIDRDT